MAANSYLPQGTLNRARTSVQVVSYPQLNITPPFLGRRSVRLTRDGRVCEYLDMLTGSVPSPELYQKITLHINLSKAQALANLFEQQLQNISTLGTVTTRTDTATLQSFMLYDSSIVDVEELSFAGDTVDYMIMITGNYPVNSALYSM